MGDVRIAPTATSSPTAQPKVHYAWVVFAVTFFTLLAASGFRSTPSVLIQPLQEEFGWSKATISTAVSINIVLFGLAGPFAAALMGRFGLRRVVTSALVLISTGALLTVPMTQPWQLYLTWGVMVGIGSGCMATVLAATVATRWFAERQGVVMGALTAATAAGQLVFLPVLSRMAVNRGWQSVSVIIALCALVAAPLVAVFLRDRPEDVGLRRYGAGETDVPPRPIERPIRTAFIGLAEASRRPAFWLVAFSFFVCGASTNGLLGTHFIPAAHDHGITETSAAGLLALIGLFDVVGTVASGWLTDRCDPRRLLLMYYGLRGMSLFFLDGALDAGRLPLWGFVVFYGLDWVATVPPTVALCRQHFGLTKGPVVFGWVFAAHQLGASIAAWFSGFTRDHTGTYRLAFTLAAILCLVAAASLQTLRRPEAPPVDDHVAELPGSDAEPRLSRLR